jgi:hypothetical protein
MAHVATTQRLTLCAAAGLCTEQACNVSCLINVQTACVCFAVGYVLCFVHPSINQCCAWGEVGVGGLVWVLLGEWGQGRILAFRFVGVSTQGSDVYNRFRFVLFQAEELLHVHICTVFHREGAASQGKS